MKILVTRGTGHVLRLVVNDLRAPRSGRTGPRAPQEIGQFPGGPFGGWEMKWSNGNAAVNGLAELRKTRLCDFS